MSTINAQHKKLGRPPVDSEELRIRTQRPLLDRLDAWRAAQPDEPGRPEAVRRMIKYDRAVAGWADNSSGKPLSH